MAGLKEPIEDLLALIQTGTIKFARIWNNQFQFMEEQSIESFPMPCAFVEVISPNTGAAIGYTVSDLTIRVHIGAVEYDSQVGTMEQNTSIFALRDEIIALLTYKMLTGCSGLQKVNEEQDFTHTNVYHYIVDFICSFVDSKGEQGLTNITTGPPTELETDITRVTQI